MRFTTAETAACCQLVNLALAEDFGNAGDVTSQAIIPPALTGRADFVARADGVISGLPAVALVTAAVDAQLVLQPEVEDGACVRAGTRLATVAGPMRSLLAVERTALNFLQRLSGVATQTSHYVKAIKDLPCRILDTRKTTPGWRLLEKYAVRCGGGHNHRMGLFDGILIKDNHLAATAGQFDIAAAAIKAKEFTRGAVPIEVEVDTLAQLRQVLSVKPSIVLLDNMTPEQLCSAVAIRNEIAPGVQLEASGGVTLATVRAIALTGVDRISVGALTHSAPALDIALDYLPEPFYPS
jgi:nicotinate-nucleotide pyrophosphorylase (carboxylating)